MGLHLKYLFLIIDFCNRRILLPPFYYQKLSPTPAAERNKINKQNKFLLLPLFFFFLAARRRDVLWPFIQHWGLYRFRNNTVIFVWDQVFNFSLPFLKWEYSPLWSPPPPFSRTSQAFTFTIKPKKGSDNIAMRTLLWVTPAPPRRMEMVYHPLLNVELKAFCGLWKAV